MNRRQDVIDAAVALLRESGPGALTSSNVAERLGITQPAIYRHVSDMDELTTLASRAVVTDLTAALMAALDAPDSTRGDGAHFTQFADRIVELIATQEHGFEVLDRWRFDDGELGAGIRHLLDMGCEAIAVLLEEQWRHNVDYAAPLDADSRRAQLAHAQLIEDDIIVVSRVIRQSTSPHLDASSARLVSLRIFAGWYAYNLDLARRCGLPTPTLDDGALRIPDLSAP